MRWTQVEGKPAVVFDEVPTILFASIEDVGNTDILYLDGNEQSQTHALTIKSAVDKLTEVEISRYTAKF